MCCKQPMTLGRYPCVIFIWSLINVYAHEVTWYRHQNLAILQLLVRDSRCCVSPLDKQTILEFPWASWVDNSIDSTVHIWLHVYAIYSCIAFLWSYNMRACASCFWTPKLASHSLALSYLVHKRFVRNLGSYFLWICPSWGANRLHTPVVLWTITNIVAHQVLPLCTSLVLWKIKRSVKHDPSHLCVCAHVHGWI